MTIDFKFYSGGIVTNTGTGDVNDFYTALKKHEATINTLATSQKPLKIYVGYHGSAGDASSAKGGYSHPFTDVEMQQVEKIADLFQDRVRLIVSQNSPFSDAVVEAAIDEGNAFFTWCYSDSRIRQFFRISNSYND
ncbi:MULTISPECIES: hypothetical protein [Pseudoalteromonas]|uniref:Uncharacterized protein n=1 Tax=Pseudoalteromonas obscura TaxID=3048491 RepID=A0ABT7ELU7_9GAMM|nr:MULTISPECIES: hypothetical protein [Pseudoalteromonas]MBQ4838037.1 hypothetical protein [Pseudoalteromonas luteoviolacea]MDK2596021.1 hypothetical protein [Pseudoalteromonas sp. P94(2023)]